MNLKTYLAHRVVRAFLLAAGLAASLGLTFAPDASAAYPEFENLASRSENVMVSAGLADPYFGGQCLKVVCTYQLECGRKCTCAWVVSGGWGYCQRIWY